MESVSARRSEDAESEMKSFSSSAGSEGFVGRVSSMLEGDCRLASPSVDCGLASPSVDCRLASPSVDCGLASPSVDCGLASPSVDCRLASPSVDCGLASPSVDCGLASPSVDCRFTSPSVDCGFASHLTTSIGRPREQKEQILTILVDADLVGIVDRSKGNGCVWSLLLR